MGNRDASGAVRVYYPSAVTEEKCARYALPIAVGHTRLRSFLAENRTECRGWRGSREKSGSLRLLYLMRETFADMGISIWVYILWEVTYVSALSIVNLLGGM